MRINTADRWTIQQAAEGGTFSITGEEGASEQQNSTDGSRRLQTAGAVDVCAEAPQT